MRRQRRATSLSGIWPLSCPTRGAGAFVAMRMARIMPGCGRRFAAPCGAKGIGRRDSLSDFNDGCKDFAELRALIVQARATAMNDADPGPPPRPRLDIERDELVMA